MSPGFLKRLEVGSRRLLFRSLTPGSSSWEVSDSVPHGEDLSGILLLRQDRIGDMIMTLPLIRRLREVHAGARICVVASVSNSAILKYENDVEIVIYRKGPSDFVSSLLQSREFAPDAAVDLHMHDSTTSLIYALASGARWRLHVNRDNRLPFNVRVDAPQDGHVMDTFAGLLSGLGRTLDTRDMDTEVRTSPLEEEFAGFFWDGCHCRPGDCAAVNISAGGQNREWPPDRFASVCRSLAGMGAVPLLISAPEHRERAIAVMRLAKGAILSPPTPTILHLSALLKGVLLLVSPDTSTVHLAASMGIPVVGMYLPFDPSLPKWHPWGVDSRVIMAEERGSLSSITADAVSSAAGEILSGVLAAQ